MGELSRQQQMLMVDLDSSPWRIRELVADSFKEDSSTAEEADPTLLSELQSDIHFATDVEEIGFGVSRSLGPL